MQIEIPSKLKKLAKIYPGELYIVGGFVRNSVMGIEKADIDLCGALKVEELEKVLKDTDFNVKIKNRILGTALISCKDESYEYTTFRKDYYTSGGAHAPWKVEFITDIREDAKRRDFTCNALYYDIKNDKIIDFYGGLEDIKNKILKTVETPDQVLSHDGIRILRLFRFQCELNFKIDKQTLECAYKYRDNLRDVSGERAINEITLILHSPNKYKSIAKPNAYMLAFKHFNKACGWAIFGIDIPKIKFKMVKKVKHKSQGFLIDLIDTVHPISISYYLNLVLTEYFGMNRRMVDYYLNVICGYYEALNHLQNKPYFFKYFDNFEAIYQLLIHKSKYLANKYDFFYKYIISHKLIVSTKDLKISGQDLKRCYPSVNPERYKAIFDSLLSDIFDGKISNEKQQLLDAVENKLKYL